MDREACVEHIMTAVREIVEGLCEEQRSWEDGHWLYVAERKTRDAMREIGRKILQTLVERKGTGHVGQWQESEGKRREFKGYREREVQTLLGPICVTRAAYWSEADCGGVVFPLDGALGVEGYYSEGMQDAMAFTASSLTYEETTQIVERLTGVAVSVSAVQNVAGVWGERAAKERDRRVPAEPAGDRVAVTVDGAMVRTSERRRKRRGSRKQHFVEHWAEAKLAAVYSFDRKGEANSKSRYTASLKGKDEFGRALWSQLKASGADRARHVAWIGDGAEWLWSLKDELLPDAVEILDFEHAKEHLESVAKAMWGETSARTRKWIHHREGSLIRGGVRSILSELKRMSRAAGAPPPSCPPDDRRRVLADTVRYFEHNAHRMAYDRYRQKGYPIGSGVVESACGHVIAQRMKITTRMSWNQTQADAILHLRCLVKSKQWDRFWGLRRLVA